MVRRLYIMVLLTALGLIMVWQGAELRAAGYDVERLQGRIADQKALIAMYESHLSKLKNPQRVTTLVGWLGLDLEQPVPEAAPEETLIAGSATPKAPAVGTVSVAEAPGF